MSLLFKSQINCLNFNCKLKFVPHFYFNCRGYVFECVLNNKIQNFNFYSEFEIPLFNFFSAHRALYCQEKIEKENEKEKMKMKNKKKDKIAM